MWQKESYLFVKEVLEYKKSGLKNNFPQIEKRNFFRLCGHIKDFFEVVNKHRYIPTIAQPTQREAWAMRQVQKYLDHKRNKIEEKNESKIIRLCEVYMILMKKAMYHKDVFCTDITPPKQGQKIFAYEEPLSTNGSFPAEYLGNSFYTTVDGRVNTGKQLWWSLSR